MNTKTKDVEKIITSKDPFEHAANLKMEFSRLREHLHQDVSSVDDPHAKALFKASAEVIDGLEKAFADFERRNELAWK